MSSATFDFAPLLPAGLPPAAARWNSSRPWAEATPLPASLRSARTAIREEEVGGAMLWF